ncbi:MAG: RNA-binding protein [Cocleimonas sp.]|nr:RNA-binding protein [Cocleimonas sp.]
MKKKLDSVRLDKWLWASRFFKTRKNAVDAISGGKVHLNGARTKPSRNIQIGDDLNITRENYRYHIEVIALNDKRRPAKEAQLLYKEREESIKARDDEREMRKMNSASVQQPDKKPNKKERRQMDKWRGR